MDNQYLGEFWDDKIANKLSYKEIFDIEFVKQSQINYFKSFFKGKTCIDIGCGLGYSIKGLEDCGLQVDAIEPDPKAVSIVNKFIRHGKCMKGFYDDLSSDKQYEILWLSHVLEHVSNPLSLLEKCYEVTKDLGILCIMVPDCTNVQVNIQSRNNKYHITHFTRNSLFDLCSNSKYEISEMQSFKVINRNKIRFHKLLKLLRLGIISNIIKSEYFPFIKTNANDGYEIRVVLKRK